jgi:DNA-binding response OmpR family regulator
MQRAFATTPFLVHHARTYRDAIAQIRNDPIAVVLSEAELPDGSWRDLIAGLRLIASPPSLIVISRLADACLWAEVLNLGGYDLLLKPLDCMEVRRVVEAAARPGQWRSSKSTGFAGA